jgi:hypothetical protein
MEVEITDSGFAGLDGPYTLFHPGVYPARGIWNEVVGTAGTTFEFGISCGVIDGRSQWQLTASGSGLPIVVDGGTAYSDIVMDGKEFGGVTWPAGSTIRILHGCDCGPCDCCPPDETITVTITGSVSADGVYTFTKTGARLWECAAWDEECTATLHCADPYQGFPPSDPPTAQIEWQFFLSGDCPFGGPAAGPDFLSASYLGGPFCTNCGKNVEDGTVTFSYECGTDCVAMMTAAPERVVVGGVEFTSVRVATPVPPGKGTPAGKTPLCMYYADADKLLGKVKNQLGIGQKDWRVCEAGYGVVCSCMPHLPEPYSVNRSDAKVNGCRGCPGYKPATGSNDGAGTANN